MSRGAKHEAIAFIGLFVLSLSYAALTNHTWEDFYITFKQSKNLALGHGLQYHADERVHGFTSPLGTLIPALLAWFTAAKSDVAVLWLFRVVSAVFLGATGVVLFRLLQSLNVRGTLAGIALCMLAFDIKSIDFSMNGMETAILLFFIVLTLSQLSADRLRPVLVGAAWAGLLWSRPDGCVYIAVTALSFFVLRPPEERFAFCGVVLRAAVVCAILYLPWFLWAFYYYGSPIPHPLTAKSGIGGLGEVSMKLLNLPLKLVPGMPELEFSGKSPTENIHLFLFAPSYLYDRAVGAFSFVVFAVVLAYFFVAKKFHPDDPLIWKRRAIVLCGVLIALYLYCIPSLFPWYLPGCAILFIAGLPFAIEWIESLIAKRVVRLFLGSVLAGQVLIFCLGSYYNYVRQVEIEEGHRKQIGLWLKQVAHPSATVFVECFGYIGYYSELRIHDYPGLVSPTVVRARKEEGPDMGHVINAVRPDYVVLRPVESRRIKHFFPNLLEANYTLVKIFDANKRLNTYRWLPWRHQFGPDSIFGVYKKN